MLTVDTIIEKLRGRETAAEIDEMITAVKAEIATNEAAVRVLKEDRDVRFLDYSAAERAASAEAIRSDNEAISDLRAALSGMIHRRDEASARELDVECARIAKASRQIHADIIQILKRYGKEAAGIATSLTDLEKAEKALRLGNKNLIEKGRKDLAVPSPFAEAAAVLGYPVGGFQSLVVIPGYIGQGVPGGYYKKIIEYFERL